MVNKGDGDVSYNEEDVRIELSNSTLTRASSVETVNVDSSFRDKIRVVIHSQKYHIAVIALVVVEVMLVILELLIDMSASHKRNYEWLFSVEFILKCISISILSAFALEIFVKLYVMQMEFFQHCLEVFDAAVITTSLFLDIVFLHDHSTVTGVGFIVVLRLWRIVRVINGIVLTVKSQADKKLNKEKKRNRRVLEQLKQCQQLCKTQQEQLTILRHILEDHGIEAPVTAVLHLSADTTEKV